MMILVILSRLQYWCLVHFVRFSEVIDVWSAIWTIDDQDLLTISKIIRYACELDICHKCWGITSEEWIGQPQPLLVTEILALLESLIGGGQDLINVEMLRIFISNQKISSRRWESYQRYVFEKWGLYLCKEFWIFQISDSDWYHILLVQCRLLLERLQRWIILDLVRVNSRSSLYSAPTSSSQGWHILSA